MILPSPVIEPQITIHPFSQECLGVQFKSIGLDMSSAASATTSTANVAIFYPFYIYLPTTIVKIGLWNGATASGNVDVGIYTSEGNRIVSSGATAQAGTSAIQTFDITDTTLLPGMYFMAFSASTTASTVFLILPGTQGLGSSMGMLADTSGHPLPATANFSKPASSFAGAIVMMYLTTRTLI